MHPKLLAIVSNAYPIVEFGVLFCPDKEGQPQYATTEWVECLGAMAAKQGGKMKLAAHLCRTRINDLLDGDDSFLRKLQLLGFQWVQINVTAVNGVDTSHLHESTLMLLQVIHRFADVEFILQKNEET